MKVLILGGYGTFGGRLARLLAEDARLSVVVAGRSRAAAEAFCRTVAANGRLGAVALDRDGPLEPILKDIAPDIAIDASGPFQVYGDDPFRVVKACLGLGICYLDLADGSAFVEGVAAFDGEARARGVFVLSGASTFPTLSLAAVRALSRDWTAVHGITAGIAPSPHVDLGRSVIGAIASYAGKTVPVEGGPVAGHALTDARRYTVGAPGMLPLRSRRFALADVPDLRLAPKLWPQLRTIWTGVATLPTITHRALSAFSWLVRLRLLRSLSAFAPLFHWVATHMRWGEHRGGLFVAATGTDAQGAPVERSWHLVAEGDDGPFVPAMAAAALVEKVLAGRAPAPGARAALDELTLADFAPYFAARQIRTGTRTTMAAALPLYRRFFSDAWQTLPEQIRALHDGVARARGLAEVERGRGWLARLAAAIMRFPPAGTDVPVEVTFTRHGGRETWRRTFAGTAFSSVQFAGRGRSDGLICERFGPLTFALAMTIADGRLRLIVRRWSAFGIPLPFVLAPAGETFESVQDGRFRFHVEIGFAWTGLIVRYQGWLVPE
ncbi:MAG TPA: DUF4166 domain-containing protein [Rhizomicrobium sp.]|jgi:hypothetical protein|nr:DUF4166 domain-containing protein [Rhizomicrobium sp.]